MSFNLNNSSQQENKVFENMKILETTVEALNQQIKNNFDPNSINPIIDQKLNTIFNGLATINNKIDFIDKKLNYKLENIEKKIEILDKKHNEDLIRLDEHMQKNTVILEFLKATVVLLEETIDVLKENKEGNL